MIEYSCEKCKKKFGNKKSNYVSHINKKFPCTSQVIICTQITQETAKVDLFAPDCTSNNNSDIPNNNLDTKNFIKKFKCNVCDYYFTRGSSLVRHMNNSKCNLEKVTQTKFLESNDKIIISELVELNKKLIEQYNEIKKELYELKKNKVIRKSISNNINKNNSSIVNSNNVTNSNNNSNNVNIQINNFGSEKYEDLNNKLFFEPMMKEMGKQIFLKTIKNIYLNPEIPENHNIMVVDRNRQICKIYNNKRWITSNINVVDGLLERLVSYIKQKYEEYKINFAENERIQDRLKIVKKYIDKCDPDFLADLMDEFEEDGCREIKKRIKECEGFYDMVYKDTVNLLHDYKDVVTKK